ncbi:MAG: DNA polymerase III subunit gamma/tau [Chitinophagaceae bacterium]|jgi:DNA polymerase-3 subunit gamma/tau|nr:DNA polymerase III subunit gamma/tau [Chitinophagaceae bacterium]OQY94750.1 MAG: DNA polymerase III subunit gamma/tau [Sphingobacteriales bacterium UTBCD1]
MEKFIVSARKYRPQTFDTVVGQAHITTTLKNAIRNKQLAHAFLFCGPRGVGKTSCARILAKTINCEHPTKDGEACNKCNSCKAFNEGTSLNYFELDAASNNSVDDIRELVNQVRFVPQSGRYKVYVIDEVHMLSPSAFNAFLKTLEEPPPYAIFILATTEKHKILPTILSRCQIFDFKRININDTVDHLQDICNKEEIKADKASLQVIAQKSEGCMRDALSILDKIVSFTNGHLNYSNTLEHLNILDDDYYFKLIGCILQQNLSGALLLYDEINHKGFEGDLVLNGFSEFIRNLLVSKDEKVVSLLEVVESFKEKFIETAKKVSPAVLISALNILNEAEISYKAARNKRLHVELALIKLCYLQQAIELTSEDSTIVKKKVVDAPLAFRITAIRSFNKEVKNETSNVQHKPSNATLVIETGRVNKNENSLVTEEAINYAQQTVTADSPSGSRLATLDKIRKQYRNNGTESNGGSNHSLQPETLQKAWNGYIHKLKETKNPAVPSFERSFLRIKDANSFEVVSSNSLEQKFIEHERSKLFLFLRQQLHNNSLQYSVVVEENPEEHLKHEVNLTAREQFQKITEQYPMVKELKDRLGLQLDY